MLVEIQLSFSLLTWYMYSTCLQCEVGSIVNNNQLDIIAVWKLLVASCVCVAEVQTHFFNVYFQHKKRSLL